MSAATIACLKITLDDVQPTVLRRMDVPFSIRLDRLHLALQAALGWSNDHLYEFRARDVGWGIPDPTWRDGPFDARKGSKNSAPRPLSTFTTSATAGLTQSRSSALPTQYPV